MCCSVLQCVAVWVCCNVCRRRRSGSLFVGLFLCLSLVCRSLLRLRKGGMIIWVWTASVTYSCIIHSNTLQHTATHCNALQHTATHTDYLGVRTASGVALATVGILKASNSASSDSTATHCNTLQHTTTHCNTLQQTGTRCNTMWMPLIAHPAIPLPPHMLMSERERERERERVCEKERESVCLCVYHSIHTDP